MKDSDKNYDIMLKEIINEIIKIKPKTYKNITNLKINIQKKYNYKKIVKNTEILNFTKDEEIRNKLKDILNIKPIRELAGVSVVALFTKPFTCPHGKCIYCPGGPKSIFGDTPQSYTGFEPAAMRAKRNLYDPYLQIFNRLEHYVINGFLPDKIEMIFMGGTFPSIPKNYRDEFVNFAYKAVNDFGDLFIKEKNNEKILDYNKFYDFFELKNHDVSSKERLLKIREKVLKNKLKNIKNFKEEIKKNETAKIRVIGLTIETKPDWAFENVCNEMLEYGVTRFELGVQTLNDDLLKKLNRGHNLKDTIKAFNILKDFGFKIVAHMMLDLPFSNLKEDGKDVLKLFDDEKFRPDMLKIYPTLLIEGTSLYELYEKGEYKPSNIDEIAETIINFLPKLPNYVRVMRIQRDIPLKIIKEGVKKANLRQIVENKIDNKLSLKEIRSREIGQRLKNNFKLSNFSIKKTYYKSANGEEYFIEYSDEFETLKGFIRLRFPSNYNLRKEINEGSALIRELHVYGETLPVSKKGENKDSEAQHKGVGKLLLKEAENLAKEKGFKKMVIISGVGVREYYKKLGYELEGAYMVKYF